MGVSKGVVMAGNDLLDAVRADLNAALDREIQVRTNYEQSLIPQLERDLQACRESCALLTSERDALLKWKKASETALSGAEKASDILRLALSVAPGDAPVDA